MWKIGGAPARRGRGVAVALCLSAAAASQASQASQASAGDLPAAVRVGSCDPLRYASTGLTTPDAAEVVVEVDAEGAFKAVRPLPETMPVAFQKALGVFARSCQYAPASVQGKTAPGVVRLIVPIPVRPGQRLLQRPHIGNVGACAPKASDYPSMARRLGWQGRTLIEFSVDAQGALQEIRVARSSGHSVLDDVAVAKLAGCSFAPGRAEDGRPVGGSFSVEYVWVLE